MRLLSLGSAVLALAACGTPDDYREVMFDYRDVPVKVSWYERDTSDAVARIRARDLGLASAVRFDARRAITEVTRCRVADDEDVSLSSHGNGDRSWEVEIDCRARFAASSDDRLSQEIAAAVSTVAAERVVVPGSPSLFEGTRYDAFSPQVIQAYCAQPWETRSSPLGRTEYNPCYRRDAFR